MTKTLIAVRGVDRKTFRKFKALTVEGKMRLGEALTLAMKTLIEKESQITRPDPKNLLKISSIIKTKNKVKWSEEIDEFLYGLEK